MGRWAGVVLLASVISIFPLDVVASEGGTPRTGNERKLADMAERVRLWSNRGPDENSIHAIGNGHLVVLAAGPDISCLFGPPYTSPNILQLATTSPCVLSDQARREPGTAIWRHELHLRNKPALRFTEFAASSESAYCRTFECTQPGIEWLVRPHPHGGFKPAANLPRAWLQCLRPGLPIFRDSKVTDRWSWHWILTSGSCTSALDKDGNLAICLNPGTGYVAFVGANSYPEGVLAAERILRGGALPLLESTRSFWQEFSGRRLRAKPIPERSGAECLELLDGIAVSLKAQQSVEGPTIIGWHAPMAYIRDLYGGTRGMLALGMFEEARSGLEFRMKKFRVFGDLRTAEFIGTDCGRHTYNDEVEGPAYVILQARDYLETTVDNRTVRSLWPMLEWCWSVQKRQLANGLLPFNGDETYIPYGLFPIEGELQGSADTTLAFIASGEWLIPWAEKEGLWQTEQAEKERRILAESRDAYRRWFVDRDRIWLNAPEREQWIEPPRFRFNVCQGCRSVLTWTERDVRSSRYLCPDCFGRTFPVAARPKRMTLNSVSLLPGYLRVEILTPEERRAIAERVLKHARPNGSIPTCNDEDVEHTALDSVAGAAGGGSAGRTGDLCVGYDPGLLLMTLTRLKDPGAGTAFRRLMRMVDSAGMWNEYYGEDDRPVHNSIRANVWASGINVEAIVKYLIFEVEDRGVD